MRATLSLHLSKLLALLVVILPLLLAVEAHGSQSAMLHLHPRRMSRQRRIEQRSFMSWMTRISSKASDWMFGSVPVPTVDKSQVPQPAVGPIAVIPKMPYPYTTGMIPRLASETLSGNGLPGGWMCLHVTPPAEAADGADGVVGAGAGTGAAAAAGGGNGGGQQGGVQGDPAGAVGGGSVGGVGGFSGAGGAGGMSGGAGGAGGGFAGGQQSAAGGGGVFAGSADNGFGYPAGASTGAGAGTGYPGYQQGVGTGGGYYGGDAGAGMGGGGGMGAGGMGAGGMGNGGMSGGAMGAGGMGSGSMGGGYPQTGGGMGGGMSNGMAAGAGAGMGGGGGTNGYYGAGGNGAISGNPANTVPSGYIRYNGQLMTIGQYQQALASGASSPNPASLSRRDMLQPDVAASFLHTFIHKRQTEPSDGTAQPPPSHKNPSRGSGAKVLMCINGDPAVAPIKFNTMTGIRLRDGAAQKDGVVDITNLPNYRMPWMPFLPTAEMWSEQQDLMLAQETMIEQNMTAGPPPPASSR